MLIQIMYSVKFILKAGITYLLNVLLPHMYVYVEQTTDNIWLQKNPYNIMWLHGSIALQWTLKNNAEGKAQLLLLPPF